MTPEEIHRAAHEAFEGVDLQAALLTGLQMTRAYMVGDNEVGGLLLPTSYAEALVVISALFGLTEKALALVGERTDHTALEVLDGILARTLASIGAGEVG